MLITPCKRSLRALALLLICLMVLVPVAGSRIFVSAALQRGEFYAGMVLHERAAQPLVHAAAQQTQQHDHAASGLNLFLHLSGIVIPALSTDWLARPSAGAPAAAIAALPVWELVFAIFEPPKRHPALS